MSRIRPVALCVFLDRGRILVMEGKDPATGAPFYRPLGGTVEFGERACAAVKREIMEEIGQEISEPRLLGVVENIFTYGGAVNHEIMFIHIAAFADPAFCKKESIPAREADGSPLHVRWVDLEGLAHGAPPLFPKGLQVLLAGERGFSRAPELEEA